MTALIVLVVVTLAARVMGLVWHGLDTWSEATRLGLAGMFVFTGASHFSPLRADFIRMVPPALPHPGLLVSLTGLLEIVGGLALLTPFRSVAGAGLAVLLVALLPANISAAQRGVTLGGRPPTALVWRLPLQGLYLGLALWTALAGETGG